MKEEQKFGIIDRIEGDLVVIVAGKKSFTVPRTKFLLEIKEGDSIDLLTYEINKTEDRKRKSRVRKLLQGLFR